MNRVKDFYSQKSIFITGGTGFIGKVLIEKLLYSCSDLKQIVVLIRLKSNQSLDGRFRDLLGSPIFERIKSEKSEILNKVKPIHGDLTEKNLGLLDEDLHQLIADTNIIFNVGASVNFMDTIQQSFMSNTVSLNHLITIAKKMNYLEVLSHVSTGYCFPESSFVEEKIYNLNFETNWIFADDDVTIQKYLEANYASSGHPSTYSFTKRLAEYVASEAYENSMPICIVRPTIVFPAYHEPLPGWVDIEISAAGELAAIGKGIKMTTLCDKEGILNLMPVDFNVRAMILAAFDGAKRIKSLKTTIPVYNINWPNSILDEWNIENSSKMIMETLLKSPFLCGMWYPRIILTKNTILHCFLSIFCQIIPCYVIDNIRKIFKCDPLNLAVKQYEMFLIQRRLKPYTLNPVRFCVNHLQEVNDNLEDEEADEFGSFPTDFDMRKYFKIFLEGTRRFILKESVADIPKAKNQLQMLKLIDIMFKILVISVPLAIVFWSTMTR